MNNIEVGDHVSIPSHAKDTVWELGWVMDINHQGALIKYRTQGDTGLYGSWLRVPLNKPVKICD